MTEVKVRDGHIERALRILKRKLDREGTIKDARNRRSYEKPSDKRYRKMKKAKYVAKMQAKENSMW